MALVAGLAGCDVANIVVTANGEESVDARIGESVAVNVVKRSPGCSSGGSRIPGAHEWQITPKSGAVIKSGWFVASEPGEYEVTALRPAKNLDYAKPATIRVSGLEVATTVVESQAAESQVATPRPVRPKPKEKPQLKVDTSVAPQANPKAIELVFASGNRLEVHGDGSPAKFTLKEARRIRMLESYHLAYPGEAPEGGYFTIRTSGGQELGPFATNRVEDSRGGIKNAYWFADVDFQLPAGTYTLIDSDPRTWTQNAGTKGVGFCGVSAAKE